jgi:hypothetical protein
VGEEVVCESCGKTFTKARSDEEAMAEYRAQFGQGGDEPPALVCDECYQGMTAKFGVPLPQKPEG